MPLACGERRSKEAYALSKILILSCLIPALALSQPSVSLRLGGTLPFSAESSTSNLFMHDYWPVGFTGSIVVQYQLAGFAAASASVEHDVFLYHRAIGWTITGDSKVLASSGMPAQLTRFGLNLRLVDHSDTNRVKPFFLVGGGYTLERYGRVSSTGQLLDGSIVVSDLQYPSQDYWSLWLGFGALFPLSRILALEPAVAYHFRVSDWSFVRRAAYGTVALQLVYRVSG